jgi:hypothetical protein
MSSLLPASNVALTVEGICKSYGETVAAGPLSFSLTVDTTTGLLDDASPMELLARYGRSNLEDVFLDVARGRMNGKSRVDS